MTFEYGQDDAGLWRWRLTTVNHRVIAVSTEEYRDEDDCTDAISLVRTSREARLQKVDRF